MRRDALGVAAVVFAAALAVHGADHLRRGLEFPSPIAVVGGLQYVVGALAVVLVLKGHRLGAVMAVAVGFPSALLFISAHLLPQGADPYTGARAAADVNAFSWFTAVLEIGADAAFGWAGALGLRRRGMGGGGVALPERLGPPPL